MPAEVIGFLREDATQGERETLRLLRQNLPKEYTVYVESPLHKKREIRYPDFVVLTSYGVIVLEVKDWVQVRRAEPHGARIRTREGQEADKPNPVNEARDFGIILSNELNEKRKEAGGFEAIPWSYAAVLINLPYPVISQLRRPWGEEFVLGHDDLIVSDLLLDRLKKTFPVRRMRALTRSELDLVRATIYPVVEIEAEGREAFVLDEQQEKIVTEPVKVEATVKPKPEAVEARQDALFEAASAPEEAAAYELPEVEKRIGQNVAIRLVRGIAGSGKSLVLAQRAKFLAAQYPEWSIAVLTFNDALHKYFDQELKLPNVRARTFHSLCRGMTRSPDETLTKVKGWLDANKFDFPVIRNVGLDFMEEEFGWIRDTGLLAREEYLKAERRGRGRLRPSPEQSGEIFTAFEDFLKHLREKNLWDWDQLPYMVLEGMDQGKYSQGAYDAILIDEAQDWAPVWFKVINRLLKPDSGLVFLADDPSQSIYRSFSWKEKGMHVVGRTRWLKVPYRNTFEIYSAAYAMIAENKSIQDALVAEGELVRPEIVSDQMRHGCRPLLQRCRSERDELAFIRNQVDILRGQKVPEDDIAVLVRKRSRIHDIQELLKGRNLKIETAHGFKGLEAEVVLLPFLQDMFGTDHDEQQEAAERRLAYMSMSRARSQLLMSCSGKLPHQFEDLREDNLVDVVG